MSGIETLVLAPLVGTALAGLGYLAKMILDTVAAYRETLRARKARLVELESLLRAAWVSMRVQRRNAYRLLLQVGERNPAIFRSGTREQRLIRAVETGLTTEEAELRQLVRGITESSLRPTNAAMLEWVRKDSFFKTHRADHKTYGKLAQALAQLEVHLILWQAKYESWMGDPKHSLIYMADAEQHGVGFPSDLDRTVGALLGGNRPKLTPDDDDLRKRFNKAVNAVRDRPAPRSEAIEGTEG